MNPSSEIIIADEHTGEVLFKFASMGDYVAERDKTLMAWETSKKEVEAAKEKEMQLRKKAVALMHDPSRTGSTENVDLGGGWKATFKVPVKYSFVKNVDGKTDKAKIERALSKIEKDGEAGELVAERLVKWTPELSLTEYKQLPEKYLKIINEVLETSTDGAPTLEIKEPKAKK